MDLRLLSVSVTTIISLIANGIVTPHALAFEAQLPHSAAPRFIAPVQIASTQNQRFSATIGLPEHLTPITKVAFNPSDWVTAAPEPAPAPTPPPAPKPVPKPPVAANVSGEARLVLEGEASYYSRAGCLGCSASLTMANGQPLRDEALTMAIGAHLKHFVGHKARVTNLANGKSTVVTITDTGGFYQAKYGHRVADLTIGTKQAIGMAGGVGQVRVEVY